MDEKYFRRCEKFNGDERAWREWAFSFRTAVGMASVEVKSALEKIDKSGDEPDWGDILLNVPKDIEDRLSAELYGTLTQTVGGEAMTIVRGVECGSGWEAYWKLAKRFDPRTPARALRAMMSVMQPKKITDVRELAKAVEEWEIKITQLTREHAVSIEGQIKSALLTGMLPSGFQDVVFQWTDSKTVYATLKDKVLALALNKAAASKPVPMEIDPVEAARMEMENNEAQNWNDWD